MSKTPQKTLYDGFVGFRVKIHSCKNTYEGFFHAYDKSSQIIILHDTTIIDFQDSTSYVDEICLKIDSIEAFHKYTLNEKIV